MEAFITGSRAYGTPRADSDVDLVVRVSPETAAAITRLSDTGKEPVRFGRLNLILCTTDIEYAVWLVGTAELRAGKGPSTQSEARQVIDVLRDKAGILDKNQSG